MRQGATLEQALSSPTPLHRFSAIPGTLCALGGAPNTLILSLLDGIILGGDHATIKAILERLDAEPKAQSEQARVEAEMRKVEQAENPRARLARSGLVWKRAPNEGAVKDPFPGFTRNYDLPAEQNQLALIAHIQKLEEEHEARHKAQEARHKAQDVASTEAKEGLIKLVSWEWGTVRRFKRRDRNRIEIFRTQGP